MLSSCSGSIHDHKNALTSLLSGSLDDPILGTHIQQNPQARSANFRRDQGIVAILSCLVVSFHTKELGYALDPDRPGRLRRKVGDPNLQINIIECRSATASAAEGE
jgi:hypothetical protein